MLQLSALAIALHGVGFGTMLTALQGLLAVTSFETSPIISAARIPVRRRVRRVPIDWEPPEERREADDEECLHLVGII